jgi:hypothetical protein
VVIEEHQEEQAPHTGTKPAKGRKPQARHDKCRQKKPARNQPTIETNTRGHEGGGPARQSRGQAHAKGECNKATKRNIDDSGKHSATKTTAAASPRHRKRRPV